MSLGNIYSKNERSVIYFVEKIVRTWYDHCSNTFSLFN